MAGHRLDCLLGIPLFLEEQKQRTARVEEPKQHSAATDWKALRSLMGASHTSSSSRLARRFLETLPATSIRSEGRKRRTCRRRFTDLDSEEPRRGTTYQYGLATPVPLRRACSSSADHLISAKLAVAVMVAARCLRMLRHYRPLSKPPRSSSPLPHRPASGRLPSATPRDTKRSPWAS